MSTLTVGRITLTNTQRVEQSRRGLRISGIIREATLADSRYVRDELGRQTGLLVAVTYDLDPSIDGFYRLDAFTDRADRRDAALASTTGRIEYTLDLDPFGTSGRVEMQSLLTGTVLENDHGHTEGSSEPFLAPPPGHRAFDPGIGFPDVTARTLQDGTPLDVYRNIDYAADPIWAVSPADYYAGAAKLYVAGRLRGGLDAPSDPTDWEIHNDLVRVRPNPSSAGRLLVASTAGAGWLADRSWELLYNALTIPEWHYMAVLRNRPELVAVRLVRDANPVTTAGRHTLDVSLRRGSRFATFAYSWSGSPMQLTVQNEVAAAGSRPGGTASYVVGTTGTHRYILGTAKAFTADLTQGGLQTNVAATEHKFWIGDVINAAAPTVGDAAADLTLQYHGALAEHVAAVRR